MIVVKKGDRDIVFFCGFLAALTAFLTTHRPSLNGGGGVFLPPLLGDIMARTTIELTEDKHILCSIAVAAVNLGIARVTLDQWIKDHKFPKNGTKVDFTELLKVRRETVEQQKKDVSDAERKTKAEADLKEKQSEKEAIIVAHMEGQIVYTDMVQDALTSLFAEIQGKCIASDNTSESDLLLLGIPQDTVTEYMRKRRERTSAMLTEFADGGQRAFADVSGTKPKRSYTKSQASVLATTTGNSKRMGRPK